MPLTFGRESLQATSKTQGDFNLQNRFSMEIDGASVTGGGPHKIEGIEIIVLTLTLTHEQSRELFHHIGKWVERFDFTRHALKVMAARANFGFRTF